MGNGADKLINRFEKYGIKISDFFASDGFVRGQVFHGYRVRSFSEIKEAYSDFVIVVSFASSREEVISLIETLDREYTVYIPDMPVAGDEYFDREFYNGHYLEIARAMERLSDEDSKSLFASMIRYKLTGKLSYLLDGWSGAAEQYSKLPTDRISLMIDAGAYNGDTVREAIEYFPHLRKAVAIEPDPKTYKRLLKYAASEDRIELETLNVAVWSGDEGGRFISSGNRNSSVSSTASHQHKMTEIELVTVDSLGLSPDFIKYDVEGAELEALKGSMETVRRSKPALLVSMYHRSRDIFELVNFLDENTVGYGMYLRRRKCFPAWEIALLLVPLSDRDGE
jgi:FkbM family methyltransferase